MVDAKDARKKIEKLRREALAPGSKLRRVTRDKRVKKVAEKVRRKLKF